MNKTASPRCVAARSRVNAVQPAATRAPAAAPKVILVIGDGMDQNQITIARHYLVG